MTADTTLADYGQQAVLLTHNGHYSWPPVGRNSCPLTEGFIQGGSEGENQVALIENNGVFSWWL
ncbi:UNVERIFIED_CONTAM: hypothetical protein Q9R71_14255 [Actinomycetes bacterium ARC8]|nr:hypothetical protein [Actinomycetes bacterium ARC8]